MLDCAAGFATLLESEGVIDDAMGMGDLPQLSNRTRTLVEDVTNASSVSNMLANCAVIRNLTNDFNNMCGEMMEKVNDLIGKDVAALAAALTKLAQWAAFAKMATSDPCALVNNNRMLQHVTQPVMEDIVKLYKGATGQLDEPEEPELPLADEVGKPPGTVIDVPKHKQAAMEGQPSFAQVADDLPVGTEVVEQQKAASPTGGYDSTPPEYVPGVGWTTPNDPDFPEDVEAKSDFSKGIEKGETPFNNSTEAFKKNKDEVEYKAVAEDKKKVAKVHKVGWCTGGTNGGSNRNEDACKATDGEWHEKEMTDNEVKMAGSVEAAMGPIAKTLADVYKNVFRCKMCGSLKSNLSGCNNCENNKHKYNKICVVENIADQWSIETSSVYQGYFHILGGTISSSKVLRSSRDLKMNSIMNEMQVLIPVN